VTLFGFHAIKNGRWIMNDGMGRREFLKVSMATGAVLAAGGAVKERVMAQDKVNGAAAVPTCFAEVGGRRLAYRSVGKGKPIVLCHRFRGVLDLWDPVFIKTAKA
jgi:hypothetical protein